MMKRVGMMVAAVALLVGAGGCGDASVVQPVLDAGAVDVVIDAVGPVDGSSQDAGQDVADGTAIDTGAGLLCEPGDGCFEESCQGAEDCLSGICTMHLGDKVCSKTCDAACPEGWSCTLVGAGGDGQYVCMSNFSHLCLPCGDSSDCSSDVPNACVSYPDELSFCGGACDLETPCPDGYGCQEVAVVGGTQSFQCVPDTNMCICSPLAIASNLSTPCENTNASGTCEGVRACSAEGMTLCDAATPAEESCNGIDDNCNGAVDEGTCDDGNACTEDICDVEAGCLHTDLNGGECLDGDACTQGDHCVDGACQGEALVCDDGNGCTEDTCDPDMACQYTPSFAACDDGDACTLGDTCKEGSCTAGVLLACDDGNPCTDESCGDAGCVFSANEADCDDGNACTSASNCQVGDCLGSTPVDCDDNNVCTNDGCDPAEGCLHVFNAASCTDYDVCTVGDICALGACASGVQTLTCDDGNPCTDDSCGPLGCVFSANEADCDDKNECTVFDACQDGACLGAGSLGCDDGNPCTVDSCLVGGGCSYVNAEGACSDGDACTMNDACMGGACQSGPSLSCADGNPCTDEVCESGACVFTGNVEACDDGNACTDSSACQGGACIGTVGTNCNDDNACTDDGCDPTTGCSASENSSLCNDGNPCTTSDACSAGVCAGAGQLACNDGNPCTDDSCDALAGCVFNNNVSGCTDGDPCTVGDACADGACLAGSEALVCNDGLYCNGVETCDAETGCVGGTPPNLDDGVGCTDDSCDEANDMPLHAPNDGVCGNGLFCDGAETCDTALGCQVGTPPIQDDALACTADSCDEAGDVIVHAPDDGACATGGTCVVDTCEAGLGCQSLLVTNCCGNGIVEQGESCDDGNQNGSDGCSANCSVEEFVHQNGQGVTWYNAVATGTLNSDQAKLSCEKTFGVCYHAGGDCAGPGWCQSNPGGKCWGWTSGCSGGAGRVWQYSSSYTTYGNWN